MGAYLLAAACGGPRSAPQSPGTPAAADGGGGGGGGGGGAGGANAGGASAEVVVERGSTDPECDGLLPTSIPEAVRASRSIPADAACVGGSGDGTGHVALGERDADGIFAYRAHAADGAPAGDFFAQHLTPVLPQASGYHALTSFGRDLTTGALHLTHEVIAPDGAMRGTPIAIAGTTAYVFDLSPDPSGGSFFVLKLAGAGPDRVAGIHVRRFAADGRSAPAAYLRLGTWSGPADPAFAAGGVSTRGAGLVVWNRGPLRELAWFAASGDAASDVFDDGAFAAAPGASGALPAYGLAPLLDGSVALQEAGRWTRRYAYLATVGDPAPDWLASRPGTTLRLARGHRGYALLPPAGEPASPCEQRVELLSPSGQRCGAVVLREGEAPCTTGAIDLAWDGTLVQQSARDACGASACTCSHRWWPGLLAP